LSRNNIDVHKVVYISATKFIFVENPKFLLLLCKLKTFGRGYNICVKRFVKNI